MTQTKNATHQSPGWDVRKIHILLMLSLFFLGLLFRDFSISPLQIFATFATGLLIQALWLRVFKVPNPQYLSALITCTAVCLLLRSNSPWDHPLTVAIAQSSKFLIRVRGKHVFNPANLAVLIALNFQPKTWVASGQWGQDIAFAVIILGIGSLLSQRARQSDVSWIFLITYFGLIAFWRNLYLGYEWTVWLHQIKSGSILLFAFFMISDPMTTPNHPVARSIHAVMVGALAFYWQYILFKFQAPLWSLFLCSFLVPIWDWILPGKKFDWKKPEIGSNHLLRILTSPFRETTRICSPPSPTLPLR